MSLQDMILTSLGNLQSDGDLRGAFQHIVNSGVTPTGNSWHPSIDIVDTPNNLYIYIELPGVSEDSINVDFFNNKLEISGEKVKKYTASATKREIIYGKFNRKLSIPLSVTSKDNVNVKYNNGVLTISVDKTREGKNRFSMGISQSNNASVDQVD